VATLSKKQIFVGTPWATTSTSSFQVCALFPNKTFPRRISNVEGACKIEIAFAVFD
jgi:hypothetical protein